MTVNSNTGYSAALTNNVYQVTGIYSLNNNQVDLNITNPTSTTVTGNAELKMYKNGYLSAEGVVTIATVEPVVLAITAQVGSRVVGAVTWLEITIKRIHPFASETNSVLTLTDALFNYSLATYNNSPLTIPLTLPIGVTSINISNIH